MASSCVLRASGEQFRPEDFLRDSSFRPCNVFEKDARRSESSVWDTSGITVVVSDADAFTDQVDDAVAFMTVNKAELQRLAQFPGLEDMEVDFGVFEKDTLTQYFRIPLKLIRLASEIPLALEVSVYRGE